MRRAAVRGLASGSRLLPQWRPAHGDRCAGAARPHPAGKFSGDFRSRRRSAARHGHRAGAVRCARRDRFAAAGRRMEVERLAAGFLDVAVESMARAIRHVSVREGHDPAEFSLLCYGGAAPQHACRVADSLGIPEILIHPLAGVLSAWGIGLADRRLMRRRSLEQPLTAESHAALEASSRRWTAPLVTAMLAQGAAPADVRVRCALEIRAPGTETALEIAQAPLREVTKSFRAEFARRFGFAPPAAPPQVATLRVEVVVAGERTPRHRRDEAGAGERPRARLVRRLARRAAARPVRARAGASALRDPRSSSSRTRRRSSKPAGRAERLDDGTLRLSRHEGAAAGAIDARNADPAQLELFNHRFMQVAEQMGAVLQATAVSVNIRERLDFSCALFDPAGRAHRERAAHARPPRLDGSERARGHRGKCGRAPPRTRLDAECALRRRDAPAGHHRREPGVRRRRTESVVLRRLARAPRRHRRHHAGLDAARLPDDRRGRRADRQLPAARRRRDPRAGVARAPRFRRLAGAKSRRRTSPT